MGLFPIGRKLQSRFPTGLFPIGRKLQPRFPKGPFPIGRKLQPSFEGAFFYFPASLQRAQIRKALLFSRPVNGRKRGITVGI